MQVTRKQIIEYLYAHHTATAVELSKILNVTAANIRHHLSELKKQEMVEEIGNLPGEGRGRPKKRYSLTKKVLDHNLPGLVDSVLNVLLFETTPEETQNRSYQIAKIMLGNFVRHPVLVQRFNLAMKWLNEHNYQSRWEASPTGPRFIYGHCPYVAIIDSNPVVCQIDIALLSQLTGSPIKQMTKIKYGPNGPHSCVFSTQQEE